MTARRSERCNGSRPTASSTSARRRRRSRRRCGSGGSSRPPDLAGEIASERWAVDSGGPAILARAYARLLATGEVDRHLRRTRREYRERRDRLVAALADAAARLPRHGVAAGLHLLLRLPPGTDEATVVARLAERRIRIRGLAGYRLTPRPHEPALVIGYGRLPLAAIDAFADQLADVLMSVPP